MNKLENAFRASDIFISRGESSVEAAIQGALDGIRKHLGMDIAFVSQFTAEERVFLFVSSDEGSSGVEVGGSDPLEASYCHHILIGGIPELVKDAASTPVAREIEATHSLPVGAHIGVPLVFSNGRVFGSICCFSHEPDFDLNERNLNVVQIAATVVAELMERHLERQGRHKELRACIKQTITAGKFEVVFQPIVCLADRRLWGLEALARFPDAEQRPPTAWFQEAKEVGLVTDLDLALIKRAADILPQLGEDIYLSINATTTTVMSGMLPEALKDAEPDRLVIELSEYEAVDDYDALSARLRELSGNWQLAVDDVGAGYSSMRHILELGPEIMKLDMAFVRKIDRRPSRAALVKAMVAFAETSGTLLIAEGIESEDEFNELKRIGVKFGQGYFLGKPMTKNNALSLSAGRIC